MRITCDIIRDLLPLYVDEVCTDSTKQAVEEHIKKCEKCSTALYNMKGKQPEPIADKETVEKAKKPFSKLKKRVIAWSCFGVIVLSFIITFGLWALEENGLIAEIRNKFYPEVCGFTEWTEDTDEWQTLTFEYYHYAGLELTDYFEYRTMLVDKEMEYNTHTRGDGEDIEIRIIDEHGNVILQPTKMSEFDIISTETLEINKKYTVQCKGEPGHYEVYFR